MPKGIYVRRKIKYSDERIAQVRNLGKSHYKHGKPKCKECGKQLSCYDACFCKKCAHKGERSRFFGHKLPEEIKNKIKKTLKVIYSDSTKTPNWKGGITPLYESIRTLPEYKQWRTEVFIRDNKTCKMCNIKSKDIEAHHIKSFSDILQDFLKFYSQFSPLEEISILKRLSLNYEPFWDIDNGQTLCVECHKFIHSEQASNVKKIES